MGQKRRKNFLSRATVRRIFLTPLGSLGYVLPDSSQNQVPRDSDWLEMHSPAFLALYCPVQGGSAEFHELPLSMRMYTSLLLPSKSLITFNKQCCNCLLYLAFNFVDFASLRSACQISKSRQKIRGSGQTSTIKIFYKRQLGRP